MGLKKGILLNEQYRKLKETVLSAERFLWSDDELYRGPIKPVGIYLWMSSHHHLLKYWFVLAESVPSEHLSDTWDEESSVGIVTLELDNNLEFVDWDPTTKTFGQVMGSCRPDGDGTVRDECEHYVSINNHIAMVVLVSEQQGDVFTDHIMQRRRT